MQSTSRSTGRSKVLWGLVAVVAVAAGVYGLDSSGLLSPAEQERLPVRIGAPPTEINALIWVADDQGFFDEVGLDATLEPFAFGRLATEAMLAGEVDFATTAEFVVASKSFEHDDLRVVSSVSESQSMNVVARRDHGIETLEDLRGKRVGVTMATQSEFFLDRLLAFNGIDPSELELVGLRPSEMVEGLLSGEIDAAATWDPPAYNVRLQLGEDAITFPGLSDDVYYFLLVARAGWLAENPETVQRVLRALAMAEAFIADNPQDAQNIFLTRFERDPDYVEYTWGHRRFALSLSQTLLSILEEQARWAINRDLVAHDQMPNFLSLLLTDVLASVNPAAVTVIR